MVEIVKHIFRVAVLAASMLAPCALRAEEQRAKYQELLRAAETAMQVRDSLDAVVASMRNRYAANEAERGQLTPQIKALEGELYRAHKRCNEVVHSVALFEHGWYASHPGQPLPKADTETMRSERSDKVRADLVRNAYFAKNLSKADYKTLCDAQSREVDVQRTLGDLSKAYADVVRLQRRYMEVATEREADSVAVLFNAAREHLADVDALLAERWAGVYDNKIYTYDLLMEGAGNRAMLDRSARLAGASQMEIEGVRGAYASDALVEYCCRKRALTEYETELAAALGLTASRDSLKVVAAALKNRDYRLSKLNLERRSFIEYEPLKVVKPTLYSPKNPIPHTKVYDYGTIYRIRIGLFANRPNLSALRGITPLSYTDAYNKGLYAYFVGGFRTEREANDGVVYLKRLGFKNPIVVAWVDGEYYPDIKTLKARQNSFNLEITGLASLDDDVKAALRSVNPDVEVSRVGGKFVVGKFDGRESADKARAAVVAADKNAVVEIVKP